MSSSDQHRAWIDPSGHIHWYTTTGHGHRHRQNHSSRRTRDDKYEYVRVYPARRHSNPNSKGHTVRFLGSPRSGGWSSSSSSGNGRGRGRDRDRDRGRSRDRRSATTTTPSNPNPCHSFPTLSPAALALSLGAMAFVAGMCGRASGKAKTKAKANAKGRSERCVLCFTRFSGRELIGEPSPFVLTCVGRAETSSGERPSIIAMRIEIQTENERA